MITFVIKSAICLTVLYGFYHLFLRNIKVFNFNRYYLLFSLIFSIAISSIPISINLNLPFSLGFLNNPDKFVPAQNAIAQPAHVLTFQNILIFIYFIVTSTLLFRFALNIFKIIKLIRTSSLMINGKTQIVLVDNKITPYSFFRYIFVYRSDYLEGKIEEGLLIHEQTHCIQYHSVDILIIEFVKILLWFNPFIWLFGSAIKLNHEYLADSKVLANHELTEYQKTLINIVFRNNTITLASNFNYSLTRKRLLMMKKKNSKTNFIRIILAIPLFLLLGLVIANAQQNPVNKSGQTKQNDTLLTPPPPPPPPHTYVGMKVLKSDAKVHKKDVQAASKPTKKVMKGDAMAPPPPPPPAEK